VWSLEYSVEAERDFELIFDHLFAAYCDLGDHPDEALECAAGRVHGLRMLINGSPRSEHCDPIFIRQRASLRLVEKATISTKKRSLPITGHYR